MENVITQALPPHPLVPVSGIPNLFPNLSLPSQFPATSLFPSISGFPPAVMTRPDIFLRPFFADPAKVQNLNLAMSLANQNAAFAQQFSRASPEEPSKKIRRLETEQSSRSENECPCCNQILKSRTEFEEHVMEERRLLQDTFGHFKRKVEAPSSPTPDLAAVSPKTDGDSGMIELSDEAKGGMESPPGDSDPMRASKTRFQTFMKIRDGQQNRIRGKLSAYHLYRGDRSETPSLDSKRAPSNASSGNMTPLGVSDTENANQNAGKYCCRFCQKPSDEWKIRHKCGHLLCKSCWDDAMKYESPECLMCRVPVCSSELSEAFL